MAEPCLATTDCGRDDHTCLCDQRKHHDGQHQCGYCAVIWEEDADG